MKTSHRLNRLNVLLAAVALGACANEEMQTNDEDNGTGNEGIFTVSNGDEDPAGDDSLDDTTSGGGSSSDDGTVIDLNCEKIDFVFVIDNSSSMADEQQHLADAVPGFIEAMQTQFPNVQSFRVGVVDTDSYPGVGSGETPLEGCPADTEGIDCASCDYQLGAFMTKPTSATDPTLSCNFTNADGTPATAAYMDGEAAGFADEFACAAIVGTEGNPIEQQVGALLASIDPAMSEEGSCNAGFMRDDALLVFLMITDEEDDHKDQPAPQGGSLGEPADWYASVVAAKNDKPTNVVALGLIGGSPRFPDCTALSQDGNGAEQSSRLENFLGEFETNFSGSVCSEGYDGFFATALEKVADGCANFIP